MIKIQCLLNSKIIFTYFFYLKLVFDFVFIKNRNLNFSNNISNFSLASSFELVVCPMILLVITLIFIMKKANGWFVLAKFKILLFQKITRYSLLMLVNPKKLKTNEDWNINKIDKYNNCGDWDKYLVIPRL